MTGPSYELFLRREERLSSEDVDTISMAAQAAVGVNLEVYRGEDDQVRGVDLGIDPDAPRAGSLLQLCLELSAAHDLTIFDPQLGRVVSAADREIIAEQMQQRTAFSLGALTTASAGAEQGLTPGGKLWLVVAALAVGMFVLSRAVSCIL